MTTPSMNQSNITPHQPTMNPKLEHIINSLNGEPSEYTVAKLNTSNHINQTDAKSPNNILSITNNPLQNPNASGPRPRPRPRPRVQTAPSEQP